MLNVLCVVTVYPFPRDTYGFDQKHVFRRTADAVRSFEITYSKLGKIEIENDQWVFLVEPGGAKTLRGHIQSIMADVVKDGPDHF